jgi:hypothetical protein
MATYYGTYGQKVQYLASDPSDPQIGQVWYNSTSAVLKVREVTVNAWASAAGMPGGLSGMSGAGVSTSGIVWGGDNGGSYPSWPSASIEFNGTSWSAGGNYPIAGQFHATLGDSQATALGVGASLNNPLVATVASYNGTAWTSGTDYPTAVARAAGAGTKTAGVVFGGGTGTAGYGAPYLDSTNKYNGTSWTASGNLPAVVSDNRGAGTQTAALSVGGGYPSSVNTTNKYNGTSWTTSGNLNYSRQAGGCGGVQTAAIYFGGYGPNPAVETATELYNGSTWTTSGNLASSHPGAAGFGTAASAIYGGHYPGVTTTEEWTGTVISTKQ